MSNPQVGHLDELIYLRPEVKTVRDPETHDDLDLTWMPMNWSATVADPTAHNGQRRLSDGTVVADPTAKDGTRQIVSRRHLQVVMPSRAEERQYVEDRPCLKCVAVGTPIVTQRGVLPVELVTPGDATLVDGTWRLVSAAWQSRAADLLEIETTHGQVFRCTPEHRVMTHRGWIEAADLRSAYRPLGAPDNRDELVGLSALDAGHAYDAQEALLLGLLVGDGHVIRSRGEIRGVGFCYVDEMDGVFDSIIAYGGGLFNSLEQIHTVAPRRASGLVQVASRPMRRVFWRNAAARAFATRVDKAHVPAYLWSATPEVRAAYLRGLFTTDGSVSLRPRPRVTFYQTTESLVLEVRLLLRSLGIHSTQFRQIRAPQYQDLYHVSIARQDSLEQFVALIGFMDDQRKRPLEAAVMARLGRDRRSPERVKRVQAVPAGNVYDLSVPEGESFLANGIKVHNCKHFDYTNGQKEIQHQLLRIPRVRAFLTGYLAMQTEHGNSIGLEEHGLCKLGAESGGEKVTSPMETCSSWKARRGGWLHTLLGGKK